MQIQVFPVSLFLLEPEWSSTSYLNNPATCNVLKPDEPHDGRGQEKVTRKQGTDTALPL